MIVPQKIFFFLNWFKLLHLSKSDFPVRMGYFRPVLGVYFITGSLGSKLCVKYHITK